MRKTQRMNKGFSLIELLIAITILSIVMIMVVQFMSTSSVAYRKQKNNLNIQTEAMTVMENISDTLMQANYVRIMTKDKGMYEITKDDASSKNNRKISLIAGAEADFDLVPDNYGNYALKSNLQTTDREVIVDFDTFEIVDKDGNSYPKDTDLDHSQVIDNNVRSFRALKPENDYRYIKPELIYCEYYRNTGTTDASGNPIYKTVQTIYHFTDVTNEREGTCSILMYRTEVDVNHTGTSFNICRQKVNGIVGKGINISREDGDADSFTAEVEDATVINKVKGKPDGLLTDKLLDFYVSADAEGNAILTNVMFKESGYEYNAVETINFRNSNVLTVRPQKLFKVKSSGSKTP